ncbi:MAG TPA: hypothetical protein VG165_16825 [Solirubrobacteraceae bacterium]|jgi:hypothetical protein|nr:hypothetical protein [Solirubrobacteraceae bacterium]
MRTPRRVSVIVFAVAILCLAGWLAVSTSSGTSATLAASLRITYTDPFAFGPVTYRLRCSPPTGTAPDPKAICAAIASQPALVLSGPGRDHSCPPTPSVDVKGTLGAKPVDVAFSACLAGQDDLISRWLALLPSAATLDSVLPDRGFGPLRLGQTRSAVEALLGPPARSSPGSAVYRPGEADGFLKAIPIVASVGYDPAGRVRTLSSNLIALTLDGHQVSSTVPRGNGLSGLLRSWTHVRCDGVPALTDHPLGDRLPTTIIESSADHPTVVISNVSRQACVNLP